MENSIKISWIQRRIKREIEQLISSNICIEEQTEIQRIDNEFIVNIKNLINNKNYEFKISNNHPFKPPKLFIDKKLINFNHKVASEKFQNSLLKYSGIECFCCQTILCSNNWSPQFTFKDIIHDINRYCDARHQVVVRIILDVIKRKYLIDDVNITEWLY
jgi:ubiquitin-protein ligase